MNHITWFVWSVVEAKYLVISLGLHTTVFPAISAGAIWESQYWQFVCRSHSNHLRVVFFFWLASGSTEMDFNASICEILCDRYQSNHPQDQNYLEKSFLRQAPWTWAGREGGSTARSSRPLPPAGKIIDKVFLWQHTEWLKSLFEGGSVFLAVCPKETHWMPRTIVDHASTRHCVACFKVVLPRLFSKDIKFKENFEDLKNGIDSCF